MAFLTASYQQLLWSPNSIGVPEGPFGRVWLSLPHLVYNSVRSLTATLLTSVLTELYISSTSTQSPTRSLKSHVWSSSSGNKCHAVHRSLSSGASVYECTMGIFFTSSHFISQFPPTRFPLITAIRMCHFLPVHHLGMAFLAGSKAKIQQYQCSNKSVLTHLQMKWPTIYVSKQTTDVKLWLLYSSTWNHLAVCKKWDLACFKMLSAKYVYKSFIYIYIYIYIK